MSKQKKKKYQILFYCLIVAFVIFTIVDAYISYKRATTYLEEKYPMTPLHDSLDFSN